MRKTALALIAATGMAAILGAPVANAFSTCSSVHSWCGDKENNKGTNREGSPAGSPGTGTGTTTTTSVPEPGTLVLLAAGVTAIGGAALRRKRAAKKSK